MGIKKQEFKIYLLTPANSVETKIIWADSEEDARCNSDLDNRVLQKKEPFEKIQYSTNKIIYENDSTICKEITSEISLITESTGSQGIYVNYECYDPVYLKKNKAVLLSASHNHELVKLPPKY